MRYSRVVLDAFGYELAPVVVTSDELEERLAELYEELHMSNGQLEALTGISERRWWEKEPSLAEFAARAAEKALSGAGVEPADIRSLIYAGVNREHFEPATACHVAARLGVSGDALIYDICNACLGFFNAMIETANRIELGQIRAGLVVSCETAREINDIMIERMLEDRSMETFTRSLATLTGGSGAVAVLLTDGSFRSTPRPAFLGGVALGAPEQHALCHWGMKHEKGHLVRQFMSTDAAAVLKHGVALGERTWKAFQSEMNWTSDDVDKVICHQVGAANRESMLRTIGISEDKDFSSYEFLGNMGTVSAPLTAALAEERKFIRPGDKVALLGIGSGLNCLMLGFKW